MSIDKCLSCVTSFVFSCSHSLPFPQGVLMPALQKDKKSAKRGQTGAPAHQAVPFGFPQPQRLHLRKAIFTRRSLHVVLITPCGGFLIVKSIWYFYFFGAVRFQIEINFSVYSEFRWYKPYAELKERM